MEKLIINICASEDSFGAYSANCDGIYGAGDTIDAVKADVHQAIDLIKANLPEDSWPAPIKGDYELEWHYDVQSLLLHYGTLLSLSGLERITGLQQKQLWSYMHGRSKPRKSQAERIARGVNRFGQELATLSVAQ